MKINLLAILLFLSTLALGQQDIRFKIEGKLLNKKTKEPVAYANIYNKILKKGTFSNIDGYFKLEIKDPADSIFINIIGYKPYVFTPSGNTGFYTVLLEESSLLLNEVIITGDDPYLYNLLWECKKAAPGTKKEGKAYFELKSYRNNEQAELMECFYNAALSGYDIKDLSLKAGRVAHRPLHNTLFASLETSRAITMHKLMNAGSRFPKSPFDLSKREMKKSFDLRLSGEYLNSEKDSVCIIDYIPKDTTGMFYEGDITVNKSKKQVVKITLRCRKAKRHPFLPLFREKDSISNVSFDITKTFKNRNGTVFFNHIDFIYVIDYKSRIGTSDAVSYSVRSNAVLYVYDLENKFILPSLEFKDAVGDYRKINAMPYNEFFWQANDEYKLNDQRNANEMFFNDSASLTSKYLFKPKYFKFGFFEHPFVQWSQKRILFREFVADTTVKPQAGEFKALQYNLAAKIFMDVNTYNDSTNVLTAVVLDPYESSYHLPLNNAGHCFINIFFDICEIERRKFEARIKGIKDPEEIRQLYDEFMASLEVQKNLYFKSVVRGTNEKEMTKWNTYVHKHLDIDNLKLFDPFKDSK